MSVLFFNFLRSFHTFSTWLYLLFTLSLIVCKCFFFPSTSLSILIYSFLFPFLFFVSLFLFFFPELGEELWQLSAHLFRPHDLPLLLCSRHSQGGTQLGPLGCQRPTEASPLGGIQKIWGVKCATHFHLRRSRRLGLIDGVNPGRGEPWDSPTCPFKLPKD